MASTLLNSNTVSQQHTHTHAVHTRTYAHIHVHIQTHTHSPIMTIFCLFALICHHTTAALLHPTQVHVIEIYYQLLSGFLLPLIIFNFFPFFITATILSSRIPYQHSSHSHFLSFPLISSHSHILISSHSHTLFSTHSHTLTLSIASPPSLHSHSHTLTPTHYCFSFSFPSIHCFSLHCIYRPQDR